MCRFLLMSCCILLTWQAEVYGQAALPILRIGEAPWRDPGACVVAYTPKGDRLITSGGGFRVWDTANGKILHDVAAGPIQFGPAMGRGIAVVGPDARQLVTLGHANRTVQLWDLTTGKRISKYTHPKFDHSAMAVSADGKFLALGGWNLDVRLFQLPDFKLIHTFRGLPEDAVPQDKLNTQEQVNRGVYGLAFSPNGKWLAVGASNGGNWVYEVEAKKLLHKFNKFNLAGTLSFSPDNHLWLAGYQSRKNPDRNTVDYWTLYQAIDVASGAEKHQIKTNGPFYPLAFSPDRKHVAYVPMQGEFAVWNLAEKRNVFHYKALGDPHVDLAFSPDGKTLAVAAAGLRMFDTKTWTDPRISEGHVSSITAAQFTPDGTQVITASYDTTTRLWDSNTGKEIHRFDGHIRNIESMSVTSGGKLAATGDSFGWIHVWDLAGKKQLARFKHTEHYYSAYSISFSPDGTKLATAGPSLTAQVFDVKTSKLVRSMRGYDGLESVGHFDVAWSPDGRTLASIGANYDSVYLWDPTVGNRRAFTAQLKSPIRGFAFGPDAEIVAYWSDNKVRMHSLKDFKVEREICDVPFTTTMAFSPNGKWFCAGSKLYDATTGKELHDFGRDFVSIAFDRASKRLLTVQRNQTTVEVWEMARVVAGKK